MATFSLRKVSETFKGLLNIDNSNQGIDGTLRSVQDGEGTSCPLQLSSSAVNINGTFKINGTTVDTTLLNNMSLVGGYTLAVTLTANTAVTFPTTGTLATRAGIETFTNKTLTAPIISTISNTGTLTLPTSTDTLVGRATTDTFTNKTLTSPTIAAGALSGTFTGTPTFSGNITFSGSPTFSTGTPTFANNLQVNNTGLKIKDTDASHYLSIVPGSNLSADRILTITTGDAARTLTLSGNVTLSTTPVTACVAQQFTSSGTYTPTTGMVYCIVEVQGAGGGGGGASGGSSETGAAGSGGAGGYAKVLLTAAQIGSSQTITIGAAGSAGAAAAGNGGNGGTSSIGTLVSCAGGNGGAGDTHSSSNHLSAANGTPGAATVNTGTTIHSESGGSGTRGVAFGNSAIGVPSGGGSSHLGHGGLSAGSGGIAGAAGTGYGAGGSGGFSVAATDRAGGAGTAGCITILEFIAV